MRRKLKEKRLEFGYTQKSFSNALGISLRTYQSIEQGITFPRERTLSLISKLLDCYSLELFENEQSKAKRGVISKNICNYMNLKSNKKYTVYHINIIRNSLLTELKERRKLNLNIRSSSKEGKKIIYSRAAKIAKDVYKTNITEQDVILYKNCMRQEYTDRTGRCTWGIPDVRKKLGYDPKTGY